MKEILSLISSSVKKGFPVIFILSRSMELSTTPDHFQALELSSVMVHSKMMALSLDMVLFPFLELSLGMDHSSCV
jgi:hypothetical protein